MPIRPHTFPVLLALLSCAVLAACEKQSAHLGLPKDDIVVAKVNDTNITRYDVEHLGNKSLGDLVSAVTSASYPRLRQAAIESRAIALAAEAELSSVEKLALDKEVAAYREQLLVRRYISKHAPAEPVTPAMINDYYTSHPERFGAKVEKSYELIAATRSLAPTERDKLLDALKDAEKTADWTAFVAKLEKGGLPVTLTVTTASDRLLHERVREIFAQLEPGKTSRVTFVLGRAYVARAKGETTRPPKPLEDVRADIQRLLEPVQMSGAVQKASQAVMATARVEILESEAPRGQGKAP